MSESPFSPSNHCFGINKIDRSDVLNSQKQFWHRQMHQPWRQDFTFKSFENGGYAHQGVLAHWQVHLGLSSRLVGCNVCGVSAVPSVPAVSAMAFRFSGCAVVDGVCGINSVFVWNSTMRKEFDFYFSAVLCWCRGNGFGGRGDYDSAITRL